MENTLEDILLNDDMPPAKSSHKGQRSRSHEGHNDNDHHDKRRKSQKPTQPASNFRKAYRGTNTEENKDPHEDRRKHDEKLLKELTGCLVDYSRQRLRALHMSFRQYGNDESKMTQKEMLTSFQDNGVSIPSRTLKSLTTKFDSQNGIDFEGMYSFITTAHGKTGRDSVLAMHKRNDLRRVDVSQEEIDEDLLWRIESQLIKSHSFINITTLRAEFQNKDYRKCGKIDANQIKQICTDQQTPVFGALLKNLIKRCDDEKNEKISWPEVVSFLEKAQTNAWISCPSLKELPAKMKNQTPVAPSPLDELSSRTRTTLVNKLRKKSTVKKPPPDIVVNSNSNMDENQNEPTPVVVNANKDSPRYTETEDYILNPYIPPMSETSMPVHLEDKPGLPTEEPLRIMDVENPNTGFVDNNIPVNIVNGVAAQGLFDEQGDHYYFAVDNETEGTGLDTTGKKKGKQDEALNTPPEALNDTQSDVPQYTTNVPIDIIVEQPSHENTPEKTSPEPKSEPKPMIKITDPETAVIVSEEDTTLEDKTIERVTIKDGQVVSVKSNDEVITQQHEEEEVLKNETTFTVNVKGRDVDFTTDEHYLDKQLIDPPIERLKLAWVYGYRGNDCRKNIHTLASGEIVYFMSFVAIIFNRDTHKQKHYKEHTDDIKCIDVHSNNIFVATGQYASRKNTKIQAHIRVWRSDTLQTIKVIGTGQFEKSIACVAFAPGLDILAAVDNSLEKKLTVWDVTSGELKGQELLNTELVCDIGFNPKEPDIVVTVGKGHLCWWKIYKDSMTIQAAAKPDFDKFLKAKFVICLTFTEKGDLVTGDSNGTIYVFGDGGSKITNYVKHAHDGPVFTVLCYKGHILSGGRDGIVHCWQWGRNMDETGFVEVPKTDGGIRMLTVFQDKLLVGTTMNSMLVITMPSEEFPLQDAIMDPFAVTQCHYDDLRGLTTVSGSSTDILTAGLDGIVCAFNSNEKKPVFKFQLKGNQYICIDTDESGTLIVLGTKDGHLQILEFIEGHWKEIVNRKLCKDRIDCIKLSPDKCSIAIGSHDTAIYIYSYLPKDDGTFVWEFLGKLKGHSSPINGIDWSSKKSEEGYLIRSSSTTQELKFWLPATLESFVKTPIISRTRWLSHSVHVHVSIAGILATKCVGEKEMTSLGVNQSETLIAMGDNCGGISLFRYPCSLSGVFCHTYKSHATVHAIRFSPCGKYVFSVGGRDSCLIQWELV